jgi:hypothetical protein
MRRNFTPPLTTLWEDKKWRSALTSNPLYSKASDRRFSIKFSSKLVPELELWNQRTASFSLSRLVETMVDINETLYIICQETLTRLEGNRPFVLTRMGPASEATSQTMDLDFQAKGKD